jgi:hypothetical protein
MREISSAMYLREQSERCLRLAGGTRDKDVEATLRIMSTEYLAKAALIEGEEPQVVVIGPPSVRGH